MYNVHVNGTGCTQRARIHFQFFDWFVCGGADCKYTCTMRICIHSRHNLNIRISAHIPFHPFARDVAPFCSTIAHHLTANRTSANETGFIPLFFHFHLNLMLTCRLSSSCSSLLSCHMHYVDIECVCVRNIAHSALIAQTSLKLAFLFVCCERTNMSHVVCVFILF